MIDNALSIKECNTDPSHPAVILAAPHVTDTQPARLSKAGS